MLYTSEVDVAVTDLRAHLKDWLARVHDGEEIIVTERGVPVARLVGVTTRARIERLIDDGVIARPTQPCRPSAASLRRPRPRRPVADRVSEQRR